LTEATHSDPVLPYGGRGHRDPRRDQPALAVERVRTRYAGAADWTLVDVSLQIANGTQVALVGPNGAGKSTLLKTIAGLIPVAAGRVRIYGNPIGACHHRITYLPQRSELDWQFPCTVAELVMTGRYVHLGWLQRPRRVDRDRVANALRRLEIERLAGRRIGDLSGGQQQRALLARAIAQEASLFLLDEPLNGLDETTRDLLDQVLAAHAEAGGCVLAATHDLGRLAVSFDSAVFLRDGRIENQFALRSSGDTHYPPRHFHGRVES
jgi:manganese/zinc/iron transport system ATP- binding protein